MKQEQETPGAFYNIRVEGELSEDWAVFFNSLDISTSYKDNSGPISTLKGIIKDQSALRGMVCKLWDLNLTIVEVKRIDKN